MPIGDDLWTTSERAPYHPGCICRYCVPESKRRNGSANWQSYGIVSKRSSKTCDIMLFSKAHSSSRRSQYSGHSISQSKMDCYLNLTKTEVNTSNRTASIEPADKQIQELKTKIDQVIIYIYTHILKALTGTDRKIPKDPKNTALNILTVNLCISLHQIIPFESILHHFASKSRMVMTFLPKKWPPKAVPIVQAGLTGPKRPWTHMKFGLPGQLLGVSDATSLT